jgi:hypothetical protein
VKETVNNYFHLDTRLGIEVPNSDLPFEALPLSEQEAVLSHWERIRAMIPDRIRELEQVIEDLLAQIQLEEDWDAIVRRFDDISEIASRINELNTWLRVDPSLASPR